MEYRKAVISPVLLPHLKLISMIGSMLATVTEPPRGISKSFAEESANASASITAHSVSIFRFFFSIIKPFCRFYGELPTHPCRQG